MTVIWFGKSMYQRSRSMKDMMAVRPVDCAASYRGQLFFDTAPKVQVADNLVFFSMSGQWSVWKYLRTYPV